MTVVKLRKSKGRRHASKVTGRPRGAVPQTPNLFQTIFEKVADALDPPVNPYQLNPVGWVHERLGEETWSKQDEILDSVRDNPKTGVWSAHGTGKSHIASRTIAWWVDSFPIDDLFIVSSAPSAPQVRGILWRYLKAAHRKAKLEGTITNAEIPEWKIDGRLVGWGRKPANLTSEEDAKAVFQGIHAKYVLVILDEADGIPKWLWDAVSTLLTNPTNRLLAIGNPDNPQSNFARIRREGEGWHKIKISAFDTPAYTGEDVSEDLAEHLVGEAWVDSARDDWGEDSPLYKAKVLAEYPEVGDDALITPAMMAKSFMAWELLPGDKLGRYAADIARLGSDKTVVYRNRGGVIVKVKEWSKATTDVTTDRLGAILEPHQGGVPMIIDIGGGLGAGPFDALRRDGYPVAQFDGSMQAYAEKAPRADGLRFQNRRSEQYWTLREQLDRGELGLDPRNLKLQAQLLNIKYETTGTGRIKIEKKEEIKKRLGQKESPDDADAVMMATVETDEWELVSQDRTARGLNQGKSETGDLLARAM